MFFFFLSLKLSNRKNKRKFFYRYKLGNSKISEELIESISFYMKNQTNVAANRTIKSKWKNHLGTFYLNN